jgi:hypothetical protein
MPGSLPCFSYKLDREYGVSQSAGTVIGMLVKALCLFALFFVAVGMIGVAIRQRRGR